MNLLIKICFIFLWKVQVDEMMNINSNQNDTNTHSRLVEQAAVTFFRDCNQRGKKIDWFLKRKMKRKIEEYDKQKPQLWFF